jgi:flagellin
VGLRINIPSLQAQRRLNETTRAFARSLQRLSSGKRINRAGDDASGLAISEGLNSQFRGLTRVVRNINDARGFLATAEGAMAEQVNILQRIREIALQAANGAIGNGERNYLQAEVNEIFAEFTRITEQTQFNGMRLLDGSFESSTIQVGTRKGQNIELSIESLRPEEIFTKTTPSLNLSEVSTDYIADQPGSVKLADFNNDGILDLLSINQDGPPRYISIKLGNGDGTFADSISSNLGGTATPGSIEYADFNEDGNLDVIYTQGGTGDLRVSLGNGDGSLENSTLIHSFAAGELTDVKAGDLDGDGHLDLVVSNNTADMISTFMGVGDGSFINLQTYVTPGETAWGIELGDFDNDNILDALVLNQSSNYASLHIGTGDGSFQAGITAGAGGTAASSNLSIGDINNDGNLDYVSGVGYNDRFYIHLGDGTGQFTSTQFGTPGVTVSRLSDMDQDGNLDLVLLNRTTFQIEIYSGDGSGDFSFTSAVATSTDSRHLDVGDINGDTYGDVVISNRTDDSLSSFVQLTEEGSAVGDIDVRTQAKAQDLLSILDGAIDFFSEQRAQIGALQSRIDSAERNVLLTRENIQAAKSQILDADMAQETAELTKNQILQQAATSVLGQANVNMQIVLSLLNGIL